LLRLLLGSRELSAGASWLLRIAVGRSTRLSGDAANRNAGRCVARSGGALRCRGVGKRRIDSGGRGERGLLFLLTLCLKLALEIGYVVVRVVQHSRLRRDVLGRRLVRRPLAGGAEDGREDHKQGRSKEDENLHVLLEDTLWFNAALLQLRLYVRLW
jgi:hypothetical protein